MRINRDNYLDKLIRKQDNGFIKIITGLRRSGKTYLLFNIFKDYLLDNGINEDQIIEMNFDSFKNRKFRNPEIFYPYIECKITKDQKYFLFLDEVQLLDDFESVLNGLSRIPNLDIYVTGSNAKFLSRDIITEFRGRGDEILLMPLSFSEFMSVYNGNKYDGYQEFLKYGGLPQVVLLDNPEDKEELLKNLLKETYLIDLLERNNIKNSYLFENVFNILASDIGSLTNPNKITHTFISKLNDKINYRTVKNYIDYLEDAFLINGIKRFDIKGRKYINALKKFYFTDLGLRNSQLNFRQLEETHIMENIIFNELLNRGYSVDIGTVSEISKNKDNKSQRNQYEVDFVCNKGSKRYYIQSALTISNREKYEQELKSLKKINDSFRKILIVKDNSASFYNDDGILIINLFDFLLNPSIIDS